MSKRLELENGHIAKKKESQKLSIDTQPVYGRVPLIVYIVGDSPCDHIRLASNSYAYYSIFP